jgi:hypothetical protein
MALTNHMKKAKKPKDRDCMDWLEKRVRWNDPSRTAKIVFDAPTVLHTTLRSAIAAALATREGT